MMNSLNELIEETPWARNFNVTGKIQNLDMNKNMTDSIDEQRRMLSSIIEIYKRCSLQYRTNGKQQNSDSLGFMLVMKSLTVLSKFIEHLANLAIFRKNLKNVFKISIKNLVISSEKVNAMQSLHSSMTTCKAKGLEKFGVTNEQLFFYAYAFGFCNGNESSMDLDDLRDHSANNVRVNVAAQYPGFQKPFHCSDDSRMMQSATDQCIIYGKDAPETHKKFIQSK
ncbi:hypothetical protein L5515_018130 [Caenorhabditis briggsae]|uniref:Peptidase M13 C-terminal domain-containing protein n=1 Tax=Caenorhabditis briggsae TaxID=6238 RepID=A0AAE9FAL7_CAEBR|nr:hypothetical protein L5515_018130 [Caenorhabditis briggsae]